MKLPSILIVIAAILLTGLAQAEQFYYAQNPNTSVRAEPSFSAKEIAKVGKGQKLTAVSKQGSWVKVAVDGKEGYIPVLQLSTQPPLARQAPVVKEEEEERPTARRRASSYTSAAAARGLTDDDGKENAAERSDPAAVKKMEAIRVTPEEVSKFKETGK